MTRVSSAFVSAVALAASFSVSTLAGGADLGPVYKAPIAAAAAPSWTGFYAGLSIGERWIQADWTTIGFNQAGVVVAPPFSDTHASLGGTAGRFGGYLGYNYQIGNWVVGVEGDSGGTWESRRTIVGIPGTGIGFGLAAGDNTSRTSVETQWDASVRLRAGILLARNVLIYGTGGLALQHVAATMFCSAAIPAIQGCGLLGSPDVTSSAARTLTGWTIGGGIEAAFWGNWLARAEYRYADFGALDNTFALGPTAFGDPVTSTKIHTHIVSFGLTYKLGAAGAGGPGAAMPVKAPAAIPTWTGFHVGLALGARRTTADWITTTLPFGLPPAADNTASFDNTAFRVGGYAGYDYQVGRAVLGAEGGVGQASNAARTVVGVPGLGGTPVPDTDSTTVKTGWDGSVVARLGYLIAPNTLVYGTGGVAFQRVTWAAICGSSISGECLFDNFESVARTLTGGTWGVGLESMFAGNWLARFDYRYADFGTFNHTFFPPEPIQSPTMRTTIRTHTASFGLAYRFNPTP